jgi:putative adhesin
MDDRKREILKQVRAGTITAEEGAARLDELTAEAAPSQPAAATTTAAGIPLPGAPAARAVRVLSQFGSAEVVADPSVAVAVAEGPHKARVDGDTLVIEHVPFQEEDTWTFGMAGRRIEINGLDLKTRRSMKVRVNPDLPLFANVQAGNVRVDGVHAPITVEVQAGNCQLSDFRSPINVVVQAGAVSASGRLDSGASKIRCEMGSVRINLEKGSSVKITARTTLGKVSIDHDSGERGVTGGGGKDVTIGSGAATLDVDCTMGNVRVSAA